MDRRLGALLAAFVLPSLVSLPALWDRRAWARRIEIARLALVVVGAGALALGGALSGLLVVVVLVGCVVSVAALMAVANSRAMLAGGALVR